MELSFSIDASVENFIDKELAWKKSKAGYFSASKLDRLMSISNKWTEANKDYLYEIQYERNNGILLSSPPNRNFKLGIENEAYAIEWLRANLRTDGEIRHYDMDFEEKPFIRANFGFGASPDADIFVDGKIDAIIEIKSAVGNKERSHIFSPTLPLYKKIKWVLDSHKWQIVGQFIVFPEITKVYLFKYDSIDSYNETDTRPADDISRGNIFCFERKVMEDDIALAIQRIKFANNYLNDKLDIEKIDEYYKNLKT